MEKDLIWQRKFCLHVNRTITPTTARQQGLGGPLSENKVQRTGLHPHHCGFPAKYGTRERPSLWDPAKVDWSAAVIGFTWAPGGTFFPIIQSKSLKSNPSSATSYPLPAQFCLNVLPSFPTHVFSLSWSVFLPLTWLQKRKVTGSTTTNMQ